MKKNLRIGLSVDHIVFLQGLFDSGEDLDTLAISLSASKFIFIWKMQSLTENTVMYLRGGSVQFVANVYPPQYSSSY